jgi:hypothetical protein
VSPAAFLLFSEDFELQRQRWTGKESAAKEKVWGVWWLGFEGSEEEDEILQMEVSSALMA